MNDADVKFLQGHCDSVRECARQVDAPANEMHTDAFLSDAEGLVNQLNANVTKTVIKGEDLLKQGFGGIYHVGKAARNPPIFACFSYKPNGAKESYALVGKTIVYDTGK